MTASEFKRLLVIAKNGKHAIRNVAMIYCAYGLGLRAKEIASLSIKDICDPKFQLLDEINIPSIQAIKPPNFYKHP